MANKVYTVFQNLDKAISGNWGSSEIQHNNSYDLSSYDKEVLYQAKDKEDFNKTKLELQQNRFLNNRWLKANADLSVQAFAGLNNVKLMYRDADLMDSFPEIGAALDIIAEECCILSPQGNVVNVYSKSERIKNVLEELFTNRLDLQITAPMIIRAMCKYGNQFMLLNVDNKLGVTGWRQLPVFNVERLENGIENKYATVGGYTNKSDGDLSTKFVWQDENNTQTAFRNWQIGHFRLLTDSLYLPYGTSYLNKARRHWRMLSLMEDMMLIYRLERSIERRVYKIFVGAIDDADVKSYVEEIANNFKRAPIIDPLTGQVDLRKNLLPVRKDTPIPLLDGRTITIEELSKEYQNGKDNYVYSIQDDTLQVCPGKVVWCGKNYTADKLVKITLDDDTYTVMAGEHEVIMRNGTKKRADELVVGESVMPFYRSCDKKSKNFYDQYEKVYNPRTGKYERTHRMVAKFIEKSNSDYNTVHHIDFNKYNNSPSNLVWCDYNEHHKMHGDLAKKMWANDEKRQIICRKISEYRLTHNIRPTEEIKKKISNTLKYKYANGDFDDLTRKNAERIIEFNKLETTKELRREYGKKVGYTESFKKYNESELHKEHNAIRRQVNIERWKDETNRKQYCNNMKVKFDDFVWDEIKNNILNGLIKSQNDLVKFINSNLIDYLLTINTSKKLHNYKKVTKPLVKSRIIENGFESFAHYRESITKNHRIKNIEFIDGDDVYCMTVVGLDGEEDRHNFAIRSFNVDGSWCDNGIFVSNCVDQDIFIPTRSEDAPTPIDTLSAAQNLTAMDDIKFVQNKVVTALGVPKSFLNFEDSVGDGKNLALMDVRFTRKINRIQQAFLMELTKIASIHLYLLGFDDELTNFSLSMNNPSTQAEQLEIENLSKKIATIRDAVVDPGNGIPIMSQTRALKEIMKWSDKDIQNNFEEIRLEKAIATELEKTTQIIKKTGIFDNVDRIYGEPGAEYQDEQPQGDDNGGELGGGGGGFSGGGGFGGDLSGDMGESEPIDGEVDQLGDVGAQDSGDIGGAEAEVPMESTKHKKPLITENKKIDKFFLDRFSARNEVVVERSEIYDKTLMINEEFDSMIKSLNELKQ